MKKVLYTLIFLPMMLSLSVTSQAQSTSEAQKTFCKSFFTTAQKYDISSMYSMGEKMFYKKGEAYLAVGDNTVIMYDGEDGPDVMPIEPQLYSLEMKKGKDPVYAYKIEIKDLGNQFKDYTYIMASEVKGKKIVTFFAWNNRKKVDLVKVELY